MQYPERDPLARRDVYKRQGRSNPSIHRNSGREKALNIAYRYRIYPTEEQKILLGKTFGCCRFLYNQMLNDKIQEYKKSKTMLKNTPAMYKKTYSFLKEVDSLALANVSFREGAAIILPNRYFRVCSALRSFRKTIIIPQP